LKFVQTQLQKQEESQREKVKEQLERMLKEQQLQNQALIATLCSKEKPSLLHQLQQVRRGFLYQNDCKNLDFFKGI
jgi:hypothetical protein